MLSGENNDDALCGILSSFLWGLKVCVCEKGCLRCFSMHHICVMESVLNLLMVNAAVRSPQTLAGFLCTSWMLVFCAQVEYWFSMLKLSTDFLCSSWVLVCCAQVEYWFSVLKLSTDFLCTSWVLVSCTQVEYWFSMNKLSIDFLCTNGFYFFNSWRYIKQSKQLATNSLFLYLSKQVDHASYTHHSQLSIPTKQKINHARSTHHSELSIPTKQVDHASNTCHSQLSLHLIKQAVNHANNTDHNQLFIHQTKQVGHASNTHHNHWPSKWNIQATHHNHWPS